MLKAIDLPPHGFVRYVDHLGSDQRIVEAARVSYKSPSKGEERDKKLLHYLWKNRHTSPFEQCSITYNINLPIFIMRQYSRHRTFRLNEWSGRYSELEDRFFLPKKWRIPDPKNKQGSIEGGDLIWNEKQTNRAQEVFRFAYQTYQDMLADGVAKELARIVLPLSLYTEIYVNCDLHNLLHFICLRESDHAQKEIRDIAVGMKQIAAQLFPWTLEAYFKYQWSVVEN